MIIKHSLIGIMKESTYKEDTQQNAKGMKRRDILKGLASLPVLGFFGYEFLKYKPERKKEPVNIFKELGLEQNVSFSKNDSKAGKPGDLIRLGIIGPGSRGMDLLYHTGFAPKERTDGMSEESLKSWSDYSKLNLEVTGICEVFNERAVRAMDAANNSAKVAMGGKNLNNVKRYKHYHDLLANNDIDAVIIATPDHHHAQMTIDAVNAGKHVYCEKSPIRTEEEIYRLEKAVQGSKQVYQLGHQIRHNPIYPYASDMIKKGILGDVNLVEVTTNRNTPRGAWVRHLQEDGSLKPGNSRSIDWDQWLGSRPKVPFSPDRYYNWTKYWDYATGLLGQLFSHEFDAVNGILNCGIPESCVSTGGIYYYNDGREIPDLMQAVFEYPDRGMTLIYSATLMNSRSRGRVFMGTEASMEIGNSLTVIPDSDSKRYEDMVKKNLIVPGKPFFTIGEDKSEVDAVSSATAKYYAERGLTTVNFGGETKDVTHLHLKEWLDVIRNGGKTSCNIDWAFQEAVTIQMALKSYLEKRQVRWDPQARRII